MAMMNEAGMDEHTLCRGVSRTVGIVPGPYHSITERLHSLATMVRCESSDDYHHANCEDYGVSSMHGFFNGADGGLELIGLRRCRYYLCTNSVSVL